MRQVRHSAAASGKAQLRKSGPQTSRQDCRDGNAQRPRHRPSVPGEHSEGPAVSAVKAGICGGKHGNGRLPTGPVTARCRAWREIACQYGRDERWGRLVKSAGTAGEFAPCSEPSQPSLRLVGQRIPPVTGDQPPTGKQAPRRGRVLECSAHNDAEFECGAGLGSARMSSGTQIVQLSGPTLHVLVEFLADGWGDLRGEELDRLVAVVAGMPPKSAWPTKRSWRRRACSVRILSMTCCGLSAMSAPNGPVEALSCVNDLGQFLRVIGHAAAAVAWNSVSASRGVR